MAETKAKPTFEELTEEIRKFNSLLQDPQPGLFLGTSSFKNVVNVPRKCWKSRATETGRPS